MKRPGSSDTQTDITEVLYDQEDIVRWTLQTFTGAKFRSDICADVVALSRFVKSWLLGKNEKGKIAE